jgi:hypothetical protein
VQSRSLATAVSAGFTVLALSIYATILLKKEGMITNVELVTLQLYVNAQVEVLRMEVVRG